MEIADPLSVALLFMALLLFLALSFFISGSEVALFSIQEKDLENIKKNSQSRRLIEIMKAKDILLATILLSNNFVNISIVILSAYVSEFVFQIPPNSPVGIFINVIVVTSVILVFGEIIPKVYAQFLFIRFSLWVAKPIYYIQKVLYPFPQLLSKISTFLLKEKEVSPSSSSLNLQDFNNIMNYTTKSKSVSSEEKHMLQGLHQTANIAVDKVMTPKENIFALSMDVEFQELLPLIRNGNHSRIPIYQDTLDNIKGILYIKDLLPYINRKTFDWKHLIHKDNLFIHPKTKPAHLLKDFLNRKKHMAIVTEDGQTKGLITFEDVVEQIVGDIKDEFDTTPHKNEQA